jgi:hypothetical protein
MTRVNIWECGLARLDGIAHLLKARGPTIFHRGGGIAAIAALASSGGVVGNRRFVACVPPSLAPDLRRSWVILNVPWVWILRALGKLVGLEGHCWV